MATCELMFEMPFESLIILFVFHAQRIGGEGFHLDILVPRMVGPQEAVICIRGG